MDLRFEFVSKSTRINTLLKFNIAGNIFGSLFHQCQFFYKFIWHCMTSDASTAYFAIMDGQLVIPNIYILLLNQVTTLR